MVSRPNTRPARVRLSPGRGAGFLAGFCAAVRAELFGGAVAGVSGDDFAVGGGDDGLLPSESVDGCGYDVDGSGWDDSWVVG